ncbi:cyclin-like protein [Haematococcus lacustris]
MAAPCRRPSLGDWGGDNGSSSACKRQCVNGISERHSGSQLHDLPALKIYCSCGGDSLTNASDASSQRAGADAHNCNATTKRVVLGQLLQAQSHALTPDKRRLLLCWMLEVVEELGLCSETLHLAVSYLDRFTRHNGSLTGCPELQLLGTTCLWLACKYEEVNTPTASKMVALTAGSCSVQQLLALEVDLLHSLGWELSQPTSLAFLHLYLQAMQGAAGPLACLAGCLLELSLLGVGGAPGQPGSAALQVGGCCCPPTPHPYRGTDDLN